ncbi:MAG: fasciclin domain-containing protein [Paludibacteraceae bacterium]
MKTFKKIGIINRIIMIPLLLAVITIVFHACEKDMAGKIYQVSDQKMIDEILESKGDTCSSFLKIIDISGLRGTVHAYGTYTLFVPTNEAIDTYLAAKGLSLNAISEEEAAKIVKYHLISDTIATSDFVDGRLPTTNFSRKYITTKMVSETGGAYLEINRQAKLLKKDLRGANGYVHIVDNVLYQYEKTIHEVIASLPDDYSLWKEVYNKSGMADVLNTVKTANPDLAFTCFIQSNSAFAKVGISSINDLTIMLREKNSDISDDQLLLFNYVAYHFTSDFRYVVDLMNLSSLKTLVDGEVIVLKRDIDKVLLNEFLIGGVLEEGIPVNRLSEYTDLSCADGVIQDIDGNIQIVKRKAYRVYWDLAEQPELMAMKDFRKSGASITFDNTDVAGIRWAKTYASDQITYSCGGYPLSISKDNNYVYGDHLRFRLSTNTMKWIEFTTPVLVPGKYKVWFSYRALPESGSANIRTTFKQSGQDDQILGAVQTSYNKSPGSYGLTDFNQEFFQKAIMDGYRYHMANSKGFWNNAHCCQALGVIEVNTTGQHALRMEPLSTKAFTTNWDQIIFIPLDEDQIWPKQDIPGKLIYENTPNCEIYPYYDCSLDSVITEPEGVIRHRYK